MLGFLADNRIQLGVRLRGGPECGELAWRRPSRAGVGNMLRNPAYAGIYAYGRSTLDPRRRQPGRPCTGRVRGQQAQKIEDLTGASADEHEADPEGFVPLVRACLQALFKPIDYTCEMVDRGALAKDLDRVYRRAVAVMGV